jgi:hypothetical protein
MCDSFSHLLLFSSLHFVCFPAHLLKNPWSPSDLRFIPALFIQIFWKTFWKKLCKPDVSCHQGLKKFLTVCISFSLSLSSQWRCGWIPASRISSPKQKLVRLSWMWRYFPVNSDADSLICFFLHRIFVLETMSAMHYIILLSLPFDWFSCNYSMLQITETCCLTLWVLWLQIICWNYHQSGFRFFVLRIFKL